MELKDVLNNHNVEGEMYLCDIRDWLGVDLDIEKVLEIRENLKQITTLPERTTLCQNQQKQ